MHGWRAVYDAKIDRVVHAAAPGTCHAVFAPFVAQVFEALRVGASLWEHGAEWFPIHAEPEATTFELEHDVTGRGEYNGRRLAEACERRVLVRGTLRGLSDLFVPVFVGGRPAAVLVVGPFQRSRPTSAEILARWRTITGRQGHLADPEFASFLGATLSVLTLDRRGASAFEQLLRCLATLMSQAGDAARFVNRAAALRDELENVRLEDRMWDAVRTMLDERTPRTWFTVHRAHQLRRLGLTRRVTRIVVALSVSRRPGVDPVDEAVRRDGLQRAMVRLARSRGEVLAGQVGDHGVVFLSARAGSVRDLSERASLVARSDFGLSLCFGAAQVPDAGPLHDSFERALAAAESALGQGQRWVDAGPETRTGALRALREELGRAAEERPDLIGQRFDQYTESVASHSGYRFDAARAHLEMGLDWITRPLLQSGSLEPRSFETLHDALDRAVADSRTVSELFAAYRRTASDIAESLKNPVAGRQDRSLRRAIEHIHRHYAEPLRLERVARVAGFHPDHFARLFKRRERMTFARYVRGLRLERAKHLLANTRLPVRRVAELSGFRSAPYLCRVFRDVVGSRPLDVRR